MVERWDADEALTQLYHAHYASLVRMASLLVGHGGEAEELVQDAFVAMHRRWRRLAEPATGLAYVRQAVINRARSALRHRGVVDRNRPEVAPDIPSAEESAAANETRTAILTAIGNLPQRQREVLVLRYYLDLSESDIADALGIGPGSVKSHASRGLSAVRATLERSR